MTKTSLALLCTLALSGCSVVDDAVNGAVNDTLSGEVTEETMLGKDRVLIINDVSLSACVVIKNGLVDVKGLQNAETLVTESNVNCATYGKSRNECIEESLAEWLDQEDNKDITDLESAQGDKACVIGYDL